MEKVLTIVIPSYNVERTLGTAIKSMIVEDKNLLESLDILVVNDGSTDGTLAVAEKFVKGYPDTVRVWNKDNGGHGSTLNVGIAQAAGKYIKIVDGDDWVVTKALGEYVKALSSTDADMVATDYYRYHSNNNMVEIVKTSSLPYEEVMSFENIWSRYNFPMHSFAVKTDMLRDQPKRMDEHCYYVDNELNVLAALVARTVVYLPTRLYVYRTEVPGQSVSEQGLWNHRGDHEKVINTLIRWYHAVVMDGAEESKRHYLEKYLSQVLSYWYKLAIAFHKDKRSEYLKEIRSYDERLSREDGLAYAITDRNVLVHLCRRFHFSKVFYSVAGRMLLLRKEIRSRGRSYLPEEEAKKFYL